MEPFTVKECVACGVDFATAYEPTSTCRACGSGWVAESREAKRRLDERRAQRAAEKARALRELETA